MSANVLPKCFQLFLKPVVQIFGSGKTFAGVMDCTATFCFSSNPSFLLLFSGFSIHKFCAIISGLVLLGSSNLTELGTKIFVCLP